MCNHLFCPLAAGSLGARITELKQKVIADSPRHYGLAVPRELGIVFFHFTVQSFAVKMQRCCPDNLTTCTPNHKMALARETAFVMLLNYSKC